MIVRHCHLRRSRAAGGPRCRRSRRDPEAGCRPRSDEWKWVIGGKSADTRPLTLERRSKVTPRWCRFSNHCSWPAKRCESTSGCRAGGSRLSAAHERSGRRRDCRDDLQSRRRSAGSLPIIQAGGCLLRPDSSKISIRRDRPEWLHQPRRRCIGPGCAIRGRARHHDAGCSLVEAPRPGP